MARTYSSTTRYHITAIIWVEKVESGHSSVMHNIAFEVVKYFRGRREGGRQLFMLIHGSFGKIPEGNNSAIVMFNGKGPRQDRNFQRQLL